ncbi:MAG: phosphoglycerate dehydrogenase [Firmicutes bacterium]|nr:phosphoglycerate dehydrogenase [Bacillota bacterium]
MANIFITSEFFGKFSKQGPEILKDAGHTIIDPYGHKFLLPDEIIKYSKDSDAFICDLEQVNKKVIDNSPALKIISRRGVGVDSVDVSYAESKGITVAKTLGVVEAPVAELVMAYILEFSRGISKHNIDLHNGKWFKQESHSVDGMTLGIVGMGKIAYEVARRAKAFNMKLIYSDYNKNEKAEKSFDAKKVSFENLLRSSDFISIHTPLNDETKGMFDYASISKMKKGAYLINTARGLIIDEHGLYRAVKERKIKGAAIDVFDVEPKENSILNELDEVILTPHIGTFTQEIFIKMDIVAAENVVNFLRR